jgi:hypothetical protein
VGIPDRLYRISKAYLGQVRDRIDAGIDRLDDRLADAQRELDDENYGGASVPSREDSSPEAMMRRAEARIAAARRELESRGDLRGETTAPAVTLPGDAPAATPVAAPTATDDPNATDFRLLGVPVGSDLAAVTAAYEKLAWRCDPRRFPEGSPEQAEAAKILEKVNASYETLRRRLDPTESRFGKLELE